MANENGYMASRDKIVVSGMSGLYPNSYNINDLSDVLYNKKNPITKTGYWNFTHPELAKFKGSVPDIEHFDAQFFKVHYRLGCNMDPTSRKLLEHTYQAIYDAGVNPENLSNKRVGVYVGTSATETDKSLLYSSGVTGLGLAGCSRNMFANRISYWLNVKSPSIAVDESCCSSAAALEMAYTSIARGDCEAAIVGGAFICLQPQTSVHCGRIINLSEDGQTKSFNKNAAGCGMSEAINVLFLQKAKDALRVYGEIVHVNSEYTGMDKTEVGPKYGFYRNPTDYINFLNTFYKEINISPKAVQYVEAVGSASPEADKSELVVIDQVFCKARNNPLLVGSVMSNIGYASAASGITAITKVLLGYYYGKLAANLNCESPRDDVPALNEGRIKILQEHTEFDRTYAAVCNLSITGVNAHVLLHGHYKPKDINRYKANIPRIVLLSGRQESGVIKIINDLKSRPIDPEEHALLHNIHETRIAGHLGRGFVILDTNDQNETVTLCEGSNYFDQGKRPLWFVYSGMGSQWPGMGKELMRIPIFAAAIERCHRVLEPKGLNIVDIISSDDKKMFDNILHSFVGIAAIQIGLTDVLRELDIHPDMIIGHSLGEIGCAYADGCFTAEETILCAYNRGLVSVETPLIRGSMAAVGLGYKEMINLCPPEIEVACHNSPESSTISGPAEIMSRFVSELTSRGYFAKEVPCSNIAYHSRYIAEAGPTMFKYLSEVIKKPKLRSARWISTSVPEDKWDEPTAKYSSAEYHTNNLLKPVLLEETLKHIPFNAVLIEIAPHGLLQAILKRSLPESCRLLPLTRRGHANNTLFLLEAIGRLSAEGFNPKVKALYPKIEFPVSTSTPMLSHLVDWAHHEKWEIFLYTSANKTTAAASKQVLSIHDDEHNYLRGHVIRGRSVYPLAAALVSVWDTLAMTLNVKPKCLSVEFKNISLHSQPIIHEQRQLQISISIQRGTGQFEVMNDKSLILRGTILSDISETRKSTSSNNTENMTVNSEEIYQLLHARDHNYMGEFCSLHSVNEALTEGQIEWKNNWVTFIDAIVQLNILRRKHNSVSRLSFIRRLVIDVDKQVTIEPTQKNDVTLLDVNVLEAFRSTVCGGVTLEDPEFVDLPILADNRIALKMLKLARTNIKNSAEQYLPLEDEANAESEETMKIVNIGDPTSLYWVKGAHNTTAGADVDVKYAGVNIVYSNRLLGINLTKRSKLKSVIDFSGTTKSGARVMGIVENDTITSKLTATPEFLWPVPAHWSLEDAATVPLAYSMAFYILFIRSQLRPHHVVCVNGGGAGALGQAVITIALAHGCQVFASVSNKAKKEFLLKLFPQLKDDHIGCSQDLSFVDMILSSTKGKGCDIIISNAKEEYNNMFSKCLSVAGIYFDTNLIQTVDDFKLGMSCLENETGYIAVDFTSVFQQKYSPNAKRLQTLMSEGITRGYVRPLTRITFASKDAFRAFHLQTTQHNRGRVLLDLENIESNALPRLVCSPSPWQLLISDNELLTLKLAERLIEQGAKKIVLFISNPSKCVHVQSRFWRENGVEIKLISDDIFNESNVFNVIHQCKKHNGLESVFIVLSKEKSLQYNKIAQTFAGIIKKSCISLKYFALVSTSNTDTVQTSQTGMTDQQIITKIRLPEIQSKESTSKNITALSINNAIDVLESLLCYKQSTILVQTYPAPRTSLLQQLSNLIGFKKEDVLEKAMLDSNLGELNIDNSDLLAIQVYLRDVYDVCLSLDDTKLLNIKSIKKLEKECIGQNFIANQGISSYFCNSDTDELLSTTDVVYLQTLLSTNQITFEVDTKKSYLYIVPGVEGHHSRFHEMCRRLKLPALVLQPGLDHPNETVPELAKRYVDIMLQKTKLKNRFYLLGYESGVCIALEMAAILEEKGITGTVYCLGGSPAEILANFNENLSIYETDEQLQMAVIKHIYSLMTNDDPNVLDKLCKNLKWHEKVDACVHLLRSRAPYSIEYAKKFFDTTYSRLTSVLQFNLQHKILQSQVISLHPQYPTSTDSSLQNYSKKKIISYQLQTPLSHATQDLMCASIINRHLDSDILEEFKNSNKCEIYYIGNKY